MQSTEHDANVSSYVGWKDEEQHHLENYAAYEYRTCTTVLPRVLHVPVMFASWP